MASTIAYTCDACGEPIATERDRSLVSIEGSSGWDHYDLHIGCAEIVDNFLRHGVRAGRK